MIPLQPGINDVMIFVILGGFLKSYKAFGGGRSWGMILVSFLHAGILLKDVFIYLFVCLFNYLFCLDSRRPLLFVPHLNFWDPIDTISLLSVSFLGTQGIFGYLPVVV